MTEIELKKAIEELEFVKDRFYELPKEANASTSIANIENAIKAIKLLEQYRAIGTIEECRRAVQKQRKKYATEKMLTNYIVTNAIRK